MADRKIRNLIGPMLEICSRDTNSCANILEEIKSRYMREIAACRARIVQLADTSAPSGTDETRHVQRLENMMGEIRRQADDAESKARKVKMLTAFSRIRSLTWWKTCVMR